MEWANTCDGYTLNQRFRSVLGQSEGPYIVDLTVSTWEANDGSEYRFNSRHVVNDKTVEDIRGRAHIRGNDRKVFFTRPESDALDLPEGTIFPTRHALELIERAAKGATFVEATVFDGSSADGLQHTTAVIFASYAPGSYEGAGETILAGLRSWRMQIAYFKYSPGVADSQPEYEIAFRLFENGVSTDVMLDYGDFTLKGALKLLELLPTDC